MQKHLHKLGLLGTALTFVAVSGSSVMALPPQAQAHAQSNASTTISTGTDSSTETSTQGSANAPTSKVTGQSHLQAGQLKACQNRQAAINNILSRIVTRGQNQLNLFNTIAQRVETFKASKNITVSNYDQLLATLQTDQTKAINDLAAMKTNDALDCSSSDPKGMVTAFQSAMKTEISDLKTYRSDVKNLIVAIKTAAGSTSTSTTTDTTKTSTTSRGGNQ